MVGFVNTTINFRVPFKTGVLSIRWETISNQVKFLVTQPVLIILRDLVETYPALYFCGLGRQMSREMSQEVCEVKEMKRGGS